MRQDSSLGGEIAIKPINQTSRGVSNFLLSAAQVRGGGDILNLEVDSLICCPPLPVPAIGNMRCTKYASVFHKADS